MRYLMHNLAVYMPYIQRESLQDMSWWNKTRKDVIKDVDCVTNFRNFLWLLQHNDNAKQCQIAAYTINKNVWIGILAPYIDIDTISFKIYDIILKCNIFKVTVEPKTWCAAEKVHLGLSQTYFSSELFCFSRKILLILTISNIIMLLELGNTIKY